MVLFSIFQTLNIVLDDNTKLSISKAIEEDINNGELQRIEEILIHGHHFNEQAVQFIKNFGSIDLQAVPGSGKTTVLIAKLMLLEKYLPFEGGSGILVISHTNVAIDQFKLQQHCPKLFAYPNFIGTIQSFVDKFLAIPYIHNISNYKLKSKIIFDDKLFESYLTSYINNGNARKLKKFLDNKKDIIQKNIRFAYSDLTTNIRVDDFYYNQDHELKLLISSKKQSDSYQSLYQIFNEIKFDYGVWAYDDAYHLANLYIKNTPQIISIIRKRFSLVLLDEMQDLNKMQDMLLELLFTSQGPPQNPAIFQRIGDIDQSIHHEEEYSLLLRNKVLQLNHTYRFSQIIANLVQKFSIAKNQINASNSSQAIKPCIIIHRDSTADQVISCFVQLINSNFANVNHEKQKYKAIGWRRKPSGENKSQHQYITSYFSNFNTSLNNNRKLKIRYEKAIEYLYHFFLLVDLTVKDLPCNYIYSCLMEVILRYLSLSNVRIKVGDRKRDVNKNDLINIINERLNIEDRINFQRKLIVCCKEILIIISSVKTQDKLIKEFDIILRDYVKPFCEDQNFLKSISICENLEQDVKNIDLNRIEKFWNTNLTRNKYDIDKEGQLLGDNIYRGNNSINVHVTTIHSTKGETHDATLYLATKAGKNGKKNDIELLIEKVLLNVREQNNPERQAQEDLFLMEDLDEKTDNKEICINKFSEQNYKILYVGLSRASKFLCIAIPGKLIGDKLDQFKNNVQLLGFEIKEIGGCDDLSDLVTTKIKKPSKNLTDKNLSLF